MMNETGEQREHGKWLDDDTCTVREGATTVATVFYLPVCLSVFVSVLGCEFEGGALQDANAEYWRG